VTGALDHVAGKAGLQRAGRRRLVTAAGHQQDGAAPNGVPVGKKLRRGSVGESRLSDHDVERPRREPGARLRDATSRRDVPRRVLVAREAAEFRALGGVIIQVQEADRVFHRAGKGRRTRLFRALKAGMYSSKRAPRGATG